MKRSSKIEDISKLAQGKQQIRDRCESPHPDAIKIKASGDDRYSGIIRTMKTAQELSVLKERVTYIRRNKAKGTGLLKGS